MHFQDELFALAKKLDAAFRPGLSGRVNASVKQEKPLSLEDAEALETQIQTYDQLKLRLGEHAAAFESEYTRLANSGTPAGGVACSALVALGFQAPAADGPSLSQVSSAVSVISLIEDLADTPMTPVRVEIEGIRYLVVRAEYHNGVVVLLPTLPSIPNTAN